MTLNDRVTQRDLSPRGVKGLLGGFCGGGGLAGGAFVPVTQKINMLHMAINLLHKTINMLHMAISLLHNNTSHNQRCRPSKLLTRDIFNIWRYFSNIQDSILLLCPSRTSLNEVLPFSPSSTSSTTSSLSLLTFCVNI